MQQWSLGEFKVIHGSPISNHLIKLEVDAAKKKNGSSILSARLFFSPILQLPMTCNILIEGKEIVRMDKDGGNLKRYSVPTKHCFLSHGFQLEITQHAHSFEIKVPDHLFPGSIQSRTFHQATHYYNLCTFKVDYIFQASFIDKDGRKCVSHPVMPSLQPSSRGDSHQQQHSPLSVHVGQKIIIPNYIFCGFLETTPTTTFNLTLPSLLLQKDGPRLCLAPCQELSIQIIDGGGVLPTTTSRTTSSWKVKFTEKISCRANDFIMDHVQHWELLLDDLNRVKIPPIRNPSFTGRLIQIHHYMIIFVVRNDDQTIVSTTPILPVQVVCSLPIANTISCSTSCPGFSHQ
jgi:hypothetical protein